MPEMNIEIRNETAADVPAIEAVTAAAFLISMFISGITAYYLRWERIVIGPVHTAAQNMTSVTFRMAAVSYFAQTECKGKSR